MPASLAIGLAIAVATTAMAATPGGNGRSPRVNYMVHCQGCHLPDGRGQAGKVPDMRGALGRFVAVPGGRDFLVQVPGSANSKLNHVDTAALLNWLVAEMGPTPAGGFTPFTAAEVARLRARRIGNVAGTRAMLIARFPAG
jgi:mono/diheme cytochrome c family protein